MYVSSAPEEPLRRCRFGYAVVQTAFVWRTERNRERSQLSDPL